MVYRKKDTPGREKPESVACRVTAEKKRRFYEKASSLGMRPTHVLEWLVDLFLEDGVQPGSKAVFLLEEEALEVFDFDDHRIKVEPKDLISSLFKRVCPEGKDNEGDLRQAAENSERRCVAS
jgi:hypothetical protein